MSELLSNKCIPCQIGADPLNQDEIEKYMKELKDGWSVKDNKVIEKPYKFKDFKKALDFTNKIGELAEEEGHHPTITLTWGKVIVTLTTFKIHGLHTNDFIMAAKIDEI